MQVELTVEELKVMLLLGNIPPGEVQQRYKDKGFYRGTEEAIRKLTEDGSCYSVYRKALDALSSLGEGTEITNWRPDKDVGLGSVEDLSGDDYELELVHATGSIKTDTGDSLCYEDAARIAEQVKVAMQNGLSEWAVEVGCTWFTAKALQYAAERFLEWDKENRR